MHATNDHEAFLIPANTEQLSAKATALAALLEKYPFQNADIRSSLSQLKTQLESSQITAMDYVNHVSVTAALEALSEGKQWLIPGLFRIWRDQNHAFSFYERIVFTISSLTLILSATFSREIEVILLDGKPKLKTTGTALMDYCSTGLSSTVAATCGFLNDGETAVFDMNRRTNNANIPTFLGNITDPINGPIPSTALQEVPSWVNPLGWINFFTCSFSENVTQYVGHFYISSLSVAKEKVQNAFPIITQSMPQLPDPVKNYIAFQLFTQEFLALFCIMMQNGGYSMINNQQNQPYGHFDGFERTGDQFERNAYLFAGAYAGLSLIALLAATTLLVNKAISKWQQSEPEREKFSIARQAHALMKAAKAEIATGERNMNMANAL